MSVNIICVHNIFLLGVISNQAVIDSNYAKSVKIFNFVFEMHKMLAKRIKKI